MTSQRGTWPPSVWLMDCHNWRAFAVISTTSLKIIKPAMIQSSRASLFVGFFITSPNRDIELYTQPPLEGAAKFASTHVGVAMSRRGVANKFRGGVASA